MLNNEYLVDVVIVRSNSIMYNPRVGRIVKSLSKRYSTAVLGWNREKITRKISDRYVVPLRLFNLRAPFGRPTLAAYFPFYWMWILWQLFKHRPKVVHACDLDSAIPCYIYKVMMQKKMIFDVCDRYAMGYIPPKFKTLYSFVNSLEELIGKNSDVLVNVSQKLLETFRRLPKRYEIIMNCSEDRRPNDLKPKENGTKFVIVYTGNIIRSRGLQEISSAINDLNGVEFVIAGRDIDKQLLNSILKNPNIRYKGLLDLNQAWTLQSLSDAMVSLYDPKDPISRFSMGNKIFEAMMNGLPIITNVASEVIQEADCGIVVDYNNVNDIRAAIVTLRDNKELRKRLGSNGRKSFLERYNWKIMEGKLFEIYDSLLKNK